MTQANAPVSLRVPLEADLLPLATSFAENAALSLGLGRPEALRLTLAVEEVFSYLSTATEGRESLVLEALGRVYCVELRLSFGFRDVDLGLFNLAAQFSPEDESSLEQLGLLLASRSVDRFFLQEQPDGGLELLLIKDKAYPPPASQEPPSVQPLADFQVLTPDAGQVKEAARLLQAHYPPALFPEYYTLPARLADMVASGDVQALVAADEHGNLGGVLFWRFDNRVTVRSYGPYVFGQPDPAPVAEALVEAVLGRVAKSQAVGFVCRYATPELPQEYFEPLGSLDYLEPDGSRRPWPHFYRQLREDPGSRVWSHPRLQDFLRETYGRLALARDIHLIQAEGESRPQHSLVAAHLERGQGHVTLRPMWDGADVEENLSRHLEVLKAEGLVNIFFDLDLGLPWQSQWVPPLLELGFTPRLVLPFGGRADVVVFQHLGESA